eukprot:m.58544 g.58544  ORF g.58544 m.58544 type:complete len:131 (-) comp11267_c0_seq2:444-836(-)
MLKSLGRRFSKGRNHAKKEGKKMPRPSIGGDELVLQTNEIGLNGVVDDEGNSTAMAITGCGSAWTKSFNIKNAATTKVSSNCCVKTVCGNVRRMFVHFHLKSSQRLSLLISVCFALLLSHYFCHLFFKKT